VLVARTRRITATKSRKAASNTAESENMTSAQRTISLVALAHRETHGRLDVVGAAAAATKRPRREERRESDTEND